ncbi:MAG: metal-dependent hydrolase [Planctomycetaceae bacterium]|nr:metal-dependent hydrolase [Planctomycetaceae bacterium]
MRLIFLGTGGYHPNERRETAGVLLPELGLLFDAGTGSYRLAGRLERDDLTILLSHAHLDHVCGLTYLLVPLHCGQIKSLRVLAAPEVLCTVRDHLFSQQLFPVLPRAEFVPLNGDSPISLGDSGSTKLAHTRLPSHPGGSRGFRLDWLDPTDKSAKSLAYITDTTVDGSYTEFIRGVDVLIHECYFPDSQRDWALKSGHSYTSQVAQLASDSNVGRLLLTHIDPQRPDDDPINLDSARAIFPQASLAEDLLEIEI